MTGQIGTAVLLLVAMAGVGIPVAAALGRALGLPTSTRAALVPLSGLTAVGTATLALGHLGLLGPWLPFGLAAGGAVAAFLGRRSGASLLQDVTVGLGAQARRFPVPVWATGGAFALAVTATLAPPFRTDEVEYHWPAAVAWAQAGGWNDSPYRHVDGFPFMEVVYTAAATQGSFVAAHLLHLTTLVALGLAAGGVARALGLTGTAAVGTAAMAMSVVWDGAYVAYNDTAVGAFGAAAVAVVLGARATRSSLWSAAGLLVVAISIKPSAVAAVGALCLVLVLLRPLGRTYGPRGLREVVGSWLVLAVPAVLTLGFWSVRQWAFTGHLVDPVATAPPDEIALTMLPTPAEQALAPLMPFVSGVLGAPEPWGGRTSLVVQVFLIPALIYVIWRRGEALRRFTLVAVPAWAHWVVLGLVIVRTRFHILSWVLLVVAVRIAVEDASQRYPRARPWLEAVWAAALVLSLLDVSLETVRLIAAEVF